MPNDDTFPSIDATLIVKNVKTRKWVGEGGRRFSILPRVGEHIEIARGSTAMVLRVVMIIHPDEPTGSVDLYATEVGTTSEYIDSLQRMDHPKSMKLVDRLMLSNQYSILEQVCPDRADEFRELSEVFENGFAIEYRDHMQHMREEMSEAECIEVNDIMCMFDVMKHSFGKLENKDGIDERYLLFEGYDGNEEIPQMLYTQDIVERQRRFQNLKGDSDHNFNSHQTNLPKYRRMLKEYNRCKERYSLTREEIIRVIGK